MCALCLRGHIWLSFAKHLLPRVIVINRKHDSAPAETHTYTHTWLPFAKAPLLSSLGSSNMRSLIQSCCTIAIFEAVDVAVRIFYVSSFLLLLFGAANKCMRDVSLTHSHMYTSAFMVGQAFTDETVCKVLKVSVAVQVLNPPSPIHKHTHTYCVECAAICWTHYVSV